MRFVIIGIVLCNLLLGCAGYATTNTLKTYSETPASKEIDIYTAGDQVPYTFEIIGTTEYEDTGFSISCSYSDMIQSFTTETRKIGGDAVKLTNIKEPDFLSTCYRGAANILKYKKKKGASSAPVKQVAQKKNEKSQVKTATNPIRKAADATIYVAVLETVSDGATKKNENLYLTNVLREEAVKVLPSDLNFTIMTRENISQMLPPNINIEECEGSCLVETGKNIAADYVSQARVSSFGSSLTISVEIYETKSNKLVYSFNSKCGDIELLEDDIRKKAPSMFNEVYRLATQSR